MGFLNVRQLHELFIIYSLFFIHTLNVLFFRPAGWDNEKKVAILYENMHSMRPDQYFTDVIAKPIVRKSTNNRDIEITAEDEQQFLLRQQQYLQQGNPTGAGAGASPAGALAGSPNLPQSIQKDPNRKSVGSPGVQSSPRKVYILDSL